MVTYSLTQLPFTTVSFKKTLLKRRSKNAENQQNLGYMELFADETSSVQNHYLDKKTNTEQAPMNQNLLIINHPSASPSISMPLVPKVTEQCLCLNKVTTSSKIFFN